MNVGSEQIGIKYDEFTKPTHLILPKTSNVCSSDQTQQLLEFNFDSQYMDFRKFTGNSHH